MLENDPEDKMPGLEEIMADAGISFDQWLLGFIQSKDSTLQDQPLLALGIVGGILSVVGARMHGCPLPDVEEMLVRVFLAAFNTGDEGLKGMPVAGHG